MARRIEVEILGDSRSLERAFARSERSAKGFNQQITRTNRATAQSFKTLGLSMKAGIGVGALALAKSFVDASRNAQVILGQTSIAVQDAGLNWATYAKSVQDASMEISRSSAFDDEAVLQSFQVFVRGQKDVKRSLELTTLAADVARGRYVDLDSATQLVNKAAMGQIGALRRAGIQIDKNATSAEALDALLRAYGGSAQKYADSAAGSSDKLRVAWENLAEQAGGPLSEALAGVAQELTIIVELMQKAGSLKFPTLPGVGGGGTVGGLWGDIGKALISPGGLPGFFGKKLFDKLRDKGGGSDAGKAGNMLDPITAMVQGLVGGVGKAADQQRTAQAMTGALGTLNTISSFIDKWAAVGKKGVAAQKAAAAAARAAADYQTRMETKRGWLDFGIERAEATKRLSDDRAAYRALEKFLQERIRREGRTLELVRDLWRARQAIRDLNKKHADTDADPLAGLMQVSSKRLANMLAAGTGLDVAGRRTLGANIAGLELRPVYVAVHIDGREVGRVVTKDQARTGRRTARQTSGFRS